MQNHWTFQSTAAFLLSLSVCVCVFFFITMCVCVKCRSGILLSLVFTTPWCRLRPHHQQRPSLCVSRFKHDASLSSMVLVYISLQTLLTKARAHGRPRTAAECPSKFIQPAETLRHMTPVIFLFIFLCYLLRMKCNSLPCLKSMCRIRIVSMLYQINYFYCKCMWCHFFA